MRDLPWFRFYKEAVDDAKLRTLAFEDRWHYVALLCCKAQGLLDGPITDAEADKHIARMRRQICAKLGVDAMTLDEIERRLVEAGLIESKSMQPIAWDKRQFKSDSSTERTREWRDRQKDSDEAPKRTKHDYTPEFEEAWTIYPERPGANKLSTFKAWSARIKQGVDAAQMIDGTRRYAHFCKAMQTEPRFIKQPATFFGPDLHFKAEWKVSLQAVGGGGQSRAAKNSAWMSQMTGDQGERDDRSGDVIDVAARRI